MRFPGTEAWVSRGKISFFCYISFLSCKNPLFCCVISRGGPVGRPCPSRETPHGVPGKLTLLQMTMQYMRIFQTQNRRYDAGRQGQNEEVKKGSGCHSFTASQMPGSCATTYHGQDCLAVPQQRSSRVAHLRVSRDAYTPVTLRDAFGPQGERGTGRIKPCIYQRYDEGVPRSFTEGEWPCQPYTGTHTAIDPAARRQWHPHRNAMVNTCSNPTWSAQPPNLRL